MSGQGLPLRVATLLTGLLECLGFAGVLFGWASLVFVFKTEHYFEELCDLNVGPLGNATGQAGKGVTTSFGKLSLVPRQQEVVGRILPSALPASLPVVRGESVSPAPTQPCLAGAWGRKYQLLGGAKKQSYFTSPKGELFITGQAVQDGRGCPSGEPGWVPTWQEAWDGWKVGPSSLGPEMSLSFLQAANLRMRGSHSFLLWRPS